jgi:hypothetical protein
LEGGGRGGRGGGAVDGIVRGDWRRGEGGRRRGGLGGGGGKKAEELVYEGIGSAR